MTNYLYQNCYTFNNQEAVRACRSKSISGKLVIEDVEEWISASDKDGVSELWPSVMVDGWSVNITFY